MLAGTMGELDVAIAHLDAASAWSTATGAELWAAWAQVQRARVLLYGGPRGGDARQSEGTATAHAALSQAGRLDLGRLGMHARALLNREA
jgi:hypothetical protein